QAVSANQIVEELEKLSTQYEQGVKNFRNENIAASAQERLNVVRNAIRSLESNAAQLNSDQIQQILRDTSESIKNSANNPKPTDSDVVV
ncbi:hypothetical protein IT409_02580, partial [Candidatus Falkowbacteria bacterium]|nr:hypothetical protein [Candidatus Falkowbacteria bacterium]